MEAKNLWWKIIYPSMLLTGDHCPTLTPSITLNHLLELCKNEHKVKEIWVLIPLVIVTSLSLSLFASKTITKQLKLVFRPSIYSILSDKWLINLFLHFFFSFFLFFFAKFYKWQNSMFARFLFFSSVCLSISFNWRECLGFRDLRSCIPCCLRHAINQVQKWMPSGSLYQTEWTDLHGA